MNNEVKHLNLDLNFLENNTSNASNNNTIPINDVSNTSNPNIRPWVKTTLLVCSENIFKLM